MSPQSVHSVRNKMLQLLESTGSHLFHTSSSTFPDFNSRNFPIINPLVAVTHVCGLLAPLLAAHMLQCAWQGVVEGAAMDKNNLLFAHWHATTHVVVLGARHRRLEEPVTPVRVTLYDP